MPQRELVDVVATEDGSPGMLNRIDVTDPPNSAPQYMLESRMIAETGCMPKVSGSNSDTPFGAPNPGSTPTRMPSRTPTTISARCGTVTAMVKPWKSSERLSIALPLETEGRSKRAVQSCWEIPFESALALERELQQQLFQSEDAKEGLGAYNQKRKPAFSGR